MRVAVTGASGFVGAAAAAALVRAGHHVIGFGRRPRPAHLHPDVDYRTWDLTAGPPAGGGGMGEVGVVLHCAAAVDDWLPVRRQRPVTVGGTRAALSTWPGARFVHVSSASVYPPWRRGVVTERDGPVRRHAGPYAQAKAEAEQVVAEAARVGRDTLVLRPHAVYGPGDPTLLPRLLGAVRHLGGRPVLVVPGPADTQVHLTSVGLLARVCVRAVEFGVTGVINVADARPLPLGQALDQALRAATGAAPRRVHLPLSAAFAVAGVLEAAARARRAPHAPALTRYALSHLGISRELDLTRLRTELAIDPPATDLQVLRR